MAEKRTFTKEKNEWKKKHTQRWEAALKNKDFERAETLRAEAGLSRPEFLNMLITEKYGDNVI